MGRDFVRKKCGFEDSNYFNQLVKGHGSFGPKTAERIEKAMEKTPGWMSEKHPIEWGEQNNVSLEVFKEKYQELKALADLLPDSDEKKQAVLQAISALSQI